jgi:hypothetical protein
MPRLAWRLIAAIVAGLRAGNPWDLTHPDTGTIPGMSSNDKSVSAAPLTLDTSHPDTRVKRLFIVVDQKVSGESKMQTTFRLGRVGAILGASLIACGVHAQSVPR